MQHQQTGSRMVGGKKPTDIDSYNGVESIDYVIPDTVDMANMYRNMGPRKRDLRRQLMWLQYAFVGVSVALYITFILFLCSWIEEARKKLTADLLSSNEVSLAWLAWVGTSLALTMGAAVCVLLEPAAASSGIPGLIAYLNGVIPIGGKSPLTGEETCFVSLKTMVAKSIGMVLSIPSGLAIGPEGPIIHISALLARFTSMLTLRLENWLMPKNEFHMMDHEIRDFLATGAACGICTAFRAPLAGCLFVVEEASSFFTTQHLEFTFVACLLSYFVAFRC